MNDLISRKAALDLVTTDKPQLLDADALYMAIDELPSVQPELDKNTRPERPETDRSGSKTGETCTDLISRQKALKQISRFAGYLDDDTIRRLQIAVEQIRPAQPETHEERTETRARDYISRQMAIDRVCKMVEECFWAADEELDAIEVTINNLPSAQPDLSQIQKMQELEQVQIEKAFQLGREDAQIDLIRCRDCKYWQDSEDGVAEVPICARPQNKFEKHPMVMMIGGDGFCSFAEREGKE